MGKGDVISEEVVPLRSGEYLIPIKIFTPSILAHLAYAKIEGSKFAQYESAKIKGRRKNATNE